MAWVSEAHPHPDTIHYRGTPPDLTGGIDQREKLSRPRLLTIEEKSDGIFMYRFTSEGERVGDTWHMSLEDAQHQAEYEYQELLSEWTPVPLDVDDPVALAFKSAE